MTGKFLIFINEADAWAKAEEEGRAVGFKGWTGEGVTKYVTEPQVDDAGSYALEVSNYTTLTESETASIQTEVLFKKELDENAEWRL